MAKQLYDYWFVQFDFPNEEGKPYKSSGGAMVWNEKLKREIPQGWHCGTLLDIAEYTNGLACQKYRPTDNNKLPVIKIKEMHDGLSGDTEWVKADIPNDVKVFDGDVLFSWSASLEVMLWAYGNGGLNQHIFKVTSKNGYPRSFYFYQLIHYVGIFKQMAEARKTTMGHITQDHLRQSTIALPPNVDIANKLEEKLCPIFDEIVKNNQEIMANFYTEVPELKYHLNNSMMERICELKERGYQDKDKYDYAPQDYADAMDSFDKVLEITGEITGEIIAPNAEGVDEEGPHCANGRVEYASGTKQNLDAMVKAGLNGMTMPRRFGGLNFPITPVSYTHLTLPTIA